MNKLLPLFFLFFSTLKIEAQSLYHQEFGTAVSTVTNGAVTDASVQAASPSNTQLTYLATNASGTNTIGVSGGTLNIVNSGTSSLWAAVRNANNFGGPPTSLMVKFDATQTIGSSGTTAPKFLFYVGSGFANSITTEAGANVHSGFGLKWQNSAYAYASTISGTDNTTIQLTEGISRTFLFVTNNSGATLSYKAPNGSTETVGDDKWDLWIGNTRMFNEQAATTGTQSLSQIKFGDLNGSNGRADWIIDNILIDPIPSIPTANTASPINSTDFTASWSTISGATDYKLDVITVPVNSDLIISEYFEGSSNNKYIEIYNGTGASVNLANYSLRLYNNGAVTPSTETALSGSLTNGSTIVYKNSSAAVYGGTATSNASVAYNGNDAIVLYKTSSSSNIDIFGRIGEDPGTAWGTGDITTLDRTLVRKRTVTNGISTNPGSGFPTLTTEWDVYLTDDVSQLGSHTFYQYVSGFQDLSVATTSKSVTGLTASTLYSYWVRAVINHTSANSNTINVTTTAGTTATFTQLTNGIASSPLTANTTNKAVLGFSATSSGSQTLSAFNVVTTSASTGVLTNLQLYISTDNEPTAVYSRSEKTGREIWL